MPNSWKKFILDNSNLTTKGFWLYSPISILAFPVSVLVVNKSQMLWPILAGGLLITILTFPFYLLLAWLSSRSLHKRTFLKLAAFVLIPALTGALRGFLFYSLVDLMNLNQPSDFANRIVGSTFTTVFWLPLANLVISASARFRTQYQSALNHFLAVQAGQNGEIGLSESSRADLGSFQESLKSSVESYLGKIDSQSFINIASALTQQINDELRPLSQRLWIRTIEEFPVVQIRRLIKDSIKGLDFSKRQFIVIVTFLSFFSNSSLRGFNESVIRTLTYLLFTFLILYIQKLLASQNLISNISFLVAIGSVPIFLSEFISRSLEFEGNWLATTLITPVPPVVIIVLSLLRLTQRDRRFILDLLSGDRAMKSIGTSPNQVLERGNLASFLHNSFQSELLALSKQLEDAALSDQPDKSARLLQRVQSLVNRSIADEFTEFNSSPLHRLESVIESWAGILHIEVNIESEHLLDESRNAAIVQTIEEVATNVSRHGGATRLLVSATRGEIGLLLILESNSVNEIVAKRGLGSAWLDQVAKVPWKIERSATSTLLSIEI